MEIYVIAEGTVVSYLLDPDFENKVPIIPSEVSHVNFTWKSGVKKYLYNFYRLKSFDESILKTPSITIKKQGRVPKRPKGKKVEYLYNSGYVIPQPINTWLRKNRLPLAFRRRVVAFRSVYSLPWSDGALNAVSRCPRVLDQSLSSRSPCRISLAVSGRLLRDARYRTK